MQLKTRLAARLVAIRACVDCEYLGGPVLASGSTDVCIYVEPRLRAWDLQPRALGVKRMNATVAPFTGILTKKKRHGAPPGGRKPRYQPHRPPPTRAMLRIFARGIQDGVVDLEREWSKRAGIPVHIRVRTADGYPGMKTIEPCEPATTRPSWSAHVARIAVKTACAASHHAVIEATGAMMAVKAVKSRRSKRKRANKAFLKQFRRS